MCSWLRVFCLSKAGCYRILLWLSVALFVAVSIAGGVMVFRAYRQSQIMSAKEYEKQQQYEQLKNKFEVQKEHVKELAGNPEFLEYTARERMQFVAEDELLFRFE